MKKGIVQVAAIPQRIEPSDCAEMVNQLLFGDTVKVLDKYQQWCWVLSEFDDYEGWVDEKQLAISNEYIPSCAEGLMTGFNAYNTLICQDGSLLYLPPACSLPGFEDGFCDLGVQRFEVDCELIKPSDIGRKELIQNALFYLNAPYLWGGKTHFGIDCSGFTQMVLKSIGIRLKRDASLQCEQGQLVNFLQETQPGDLAFFDNEEGKITHVGIVIDHQKIIHASGRVRIDYLDNEGIIHSDTQQRTHQLRILRNFF